MSSRRRAIRALAVAGVLGLATVTSGHVGSPTVFFDGMAGPYAMRVIVRPPEVVPGLAQIIVQSSAGDIRRVVVRPVYWRAGLAGSPAGDVAERIDGDRPAWSASLWFMQRGAYSVYVTVDGAQGSGTVTVPVMAVATSTLGLSPGLMILLGLLGIGLVAGLLNIVRAASSEALVEPGAPLTAQTRRRGRLAAAVALPVLALLLTGGALWWRAVDADYQRSLYRAPAFVPTVSASPEGATLTFVVRDTAGLAPLAPIMPDHGKMMHLYLVRDSTLDVLAHLHPTVREDSIFVTPLPALPAGRYRAFGDVVLETGSSLTLTTLVDLPAIPASSPALTADEGWEGAVPVARVADRLPLRVADGLTIEWAATADPIVSEEPLDLRFIVRDAAGAAVAFEPYLGMAGHAAVMRTDGSVFVHLHPMGTVAPGAQEVFALRDRGDTTADGRLVVRDPRGAGAHGMPMGRAGSLIFPYEFPRAGDYRVFVQFRHGGRIVTAAFDVTVGERGR